MRLAWVRTTPFGWPVVPEVENIAAVSDAWPFSTSARKKSGLRASNSRPAAWRLSKLASPGCV